ncbi:MAG: hypothetical protein LC674_00470 [Actinobacteria bacterium]|nr:hypothetical protein [Actinomycetota bacterium]
MSAAFYPILNDPGGSIDATFDGKAYQGPSTFQTELRATLALLQSPPRTLSQWAMDNVHGFCQRSSPEMMIPGVVL